MNDQEIYSLDEVFSMVANGSMEYDEFTDWVWEIEKAAAKKYGKSLDTSPE